LKVGDCRTTDIARLHLQGGEDILRYSPLIDERGTVQRVARHQYIYFLVHDSHERFKVGRSTTPLVRWAKIQPHAQTDFAASLVFDLSDNVRPGWVEETFHRALAASRFEMPSHLDGHTEWFDYSVFDVACAFARTHRDLLGIGEGYAISAPQTPDSALVIKRPRNRRPASAGECFDAAVLHNESVAATMESHISALITSGALLGSAGDQC
jgi:hypothetical protein